MTSWSGSRKGSGLSRTERTMVKRDVDAPMPRAITRIAVVEKLGERRRVRNPYRASRQSPSSQFQFHDERAASRLRRNSIKTLIRNCSHQRMPYLILLQAVDDQVDRGRKPLPALFLFF